MYTKNLNRVNEIKEKFQKLKSLDKDFKIFGAHFHEYGFNPTLSETQIKEFEKNHSIKIPEEYRLYLENIGDGKAGPFYGIYELNYNDGNSSDLSKPFPCTQKEPFKMMDAYDTIPENLSDDEYNEFLNNIYGQATNGLIFLATEGCGMYSVLVVNGEEYGNVWYYDLANDAGIFPLVNPKTKKPMRFFEWLEIWLDCQIKEQETGNESFQSYADFIADINS